MCVCVCVCVCVYRYYTWWSLCVNLTQARVIREKGASTEELSPGDPAVRHFSQLMITGGGLSLAGGAFCRLVVLGSTRKQAE